MNYTNLDSRLKLHSLSPSFLRRLKKIRKNSLKARAATPKKNPPPSTDGLVAG
ncbi:hypothetical protein EI77_03260 [Prosthecobacter fusiformis]|uniref:Uncharacterized protein n=1 Tax=Prosthecobacter fusiformis TaxID=48464 RepID=A0A4V3FET0_9BACT|nr:hypothetical protein [Prosthecobacter fusiformis]TDU68143.1 hypothetical protein EI77_03260 [Prosthecobacter fusiformis]